MLNLAVIAIKCGGNVSDVALVSKLIQNVNTVALSASGKSYKRRVFNVADEGTERRRTFILLENCQWNEKADNALQYVLQYVQQRHS